MREDGVGDTVRAEFRPNRVGRYKPDWGRLRRDSLMEPQ